MKPSALFLSALIGLGMFVWAAPVKAAESPTPRPTVTIKACHICEEEDPRQAQTPMPTPVVHFWFFFDSGCYGCLKVYNSVLPRILAQYEPGQVGMRPWDVSQFGTAAQRAMEQQYGIAQGASTEIFIGEYVLQGSQEIETRLPQLIDRYLAQGGVALVELSATTLPTATRTPMHPPTPSPTPGLGAAVPLPVVRAVLFWSNTCPHCHEVINHVLPPLQKKYGNRLDIRMFELSEPANLQLFEAALDALRVPPEYWGVPFMIVGDQILVGSLDIPERLPGLVEKHLAAGGIGWPPIPGLDKFVGAPMATATRATSPITTTPTPVVRLIVNDTPLPMTPAAPTRVALAPTQPVVRAVLFWMNGCPHCEQVITRVLPPLQQKYGAQLDLRFVEVVTTQDVDQLYKWGAAFGLAKEQIGVPFLVIGNRALVGSDQIPAELPTLIEQYLAAGGIDFPTLAGLDAARLPTPATSVPICLPTVPDCGTETGRELPVQVILRQDPVGFALAIVVILGMIGALVRVGTEVVTRRSRVSPAWSIWAVPLLIVLGLGVASYLAYVEILEVSAICGPVGHCNTVQQSPYARLFGVLPIGVLGVLGYLAILGAWFISLLGRAKVGALAHRAAFAFTVCGVLFSLYLTFLEPFVIGAVCAWCLTSAVIMTALMLLLARPTLQSFKLKHD